MGGMIVHVGEKCVCKNQDSEAQPHPKSFLKPQFSVISGSSQTWDNSKILPEQTTLIYCPLKDNARFSCSFQCSPSFKVKKLSFGEEKKRVHV